MKASIGLRRILAVLLGAGLLLLPTVTAAAATGADLSVTKSDAPDPVLVGSNITYTIGVANGGPDAATNAALSDSTPANTTFVSLSSPAGWSCSTPAVGGTGTVSCTNASLASGASGTFALVVNVNPATPSGTVISNTVSVSSATSDPDSTDNSATTTTVAGTGADLSVTKTDSPDPVTDGANLTYSIVVANAGPATATNAALSDATPSNTTFVSLATPAGWTCSTPAVGGTGTVTCSNPSFGAGGTATFTLVVNVSSGTADGTVISNTATVSSSMTDPDSTDNSATATTTVGLVGVICTIEGTNHSDTLTGTPGDDVICGGNGKDTIDGLGGNDIIYGGHGKDELTGGDGNDTLVGGNGKDELTGGAGLDVLDGGNGKDKLDAKDGVGGDLLDGGKGKDTCETDPGDTVVDC